MDDHDHIEDEDREALEGLSTTPALRTKKIHSYSQQLRAGEKSYHSQGIRKHSLDGLPNAVLENIYDSDDDFFANIVGDEEEDYYVSQVDEPRQSQALPEFVGSGGGVGIFKMPARSAVHPGRPPCLELRPHPLRETQVGKFLRNIACTDTQLWAGQESGVRFWKLQNAYDVGIGLSNRVRRGDEDAAPFHESVNTSPTMCLMVDDGNRLVWSGHKDGKIRSWKMDLSTEETKAAFKEGLSWQAHRGPVLAMIFSSHGKIMYTSFDADEMKSEICIFFNVFELLQVIYGQEERVVSLRFGHGNLLRNLFLLNLKKSIWLHY